MKGMYDLGTTVPSSKAFVVRNTMDVTREQRERAQKETEYNAFSFPADLLAVDYLSDSGATSMTDAQWAAMHFGDESYGRNIGYYLLLDAIRDTFERGDEPHNAFAMRFSGRPDVEQLSKELYLASYEGGFVNGGVAQLARPNAFITPQGRAAEYLLFSTLRRVLDEQNGPGKEYWIPNNGHFDTTGANIRAVGIKTINLFHPRLFEPFPHEEMDDHNPFKGNMDTERLEALIKEKGPDAVPLIYLTITNNTMAGQPVAMANIRAVSEIAERYGIPFFLDACRFAENAMFIKSFEEGYADRSIPSIVKEMFALADGFTISLKKDGLANMGGGLFFRDRGVFHRKYSTGGDIGVRLKEKQILTFGNDSYGGVSGRDIMTLVVGLREVVKDAYLNERLGQTRYLARGFAREGVPVILPAGGHAVYLDVERFFEGTDMQTGDFGGVGISIELIRHFGIRACELGPFAFEYDRKTEEERKGIINVVRFAIPRNAYNKAHFDYTIAAVAELHKHRDTVPKTEISRGAELSLRHFQTGLRPIYR